MTLTEFRPISPPVRARAEDQVHMIFIMDVALVENAADEIDDTVANEVDYIAGIDDDSEIEDENGDEPFHEHLVLN